MRVHDNWSLNENFPTVAVMYSAVCGCRFMLCQRLKRAVQTAIFQKQNTYFMINATSSPYLVSLYATYNQ